MQALEAFVTLEVVDTAFTKVEAKMVEVADDQEGIAGRRDATKGATTEEGTIQGVTTEWASNAVGKNAKVVEVAPKNGAN